ncbi:hypothetical protein EF910_05670 [Streptomyces sp. WAC07149]|uniref:hypothetical protein n=1 Tax=Streptomyces sp. WAC07149 TaxID=2487425 RepID=UPI000F7B3486|nr:hypothetical protein [Streptomyces sp. WAC07149]RST07925.1 hypothetical protein EF910_05670 [Streptomyces sp. WAC07149]
MGLVSEQDGNGHAVEVKVKGFYTFTIQLECDGLYDAGIRTSISHRIKPGEWLDLIKEDYTANAGSKTKTKVYTIPKKYYQAGERIYTYAKVAINGADPRFTAGGYFKATFHGQ